MTKDEAALLRAAIAAALAGGAAPTAIARDLGCARATVYKVQARIAAGATPVFDGRAAGAGLCLWPDELREAVLALRRRNPSWGARILHAHLTRGGLGGVPPSAIPSPSTIGRWLTAEGLARKPIGPADTRVFPDARVTDPGEIALDGWGPWHIRSTNLYLCTAQDRFTRLALAVPALGGPVSQAQRGLTAAHWQHTLALACERLLPAHPLRRVRLDNGVGLAPIFRVLGPTTRLALARGATVVFTPPGQPWRNGRLERFHWTMETEYFRDQRPTSIAAAVDGLVEWLNFYNQDRPHSRLGYQAPAERAAYAPLDRGALELRTWTVERTAGVVECLRLVLNDGAVELWQGEWLAVSPLLAGQYVRVTFEVPGPGPGHVTYRMKGPREVVVATFEHCLDAEGARGFDSLVWNTRLFEFDGSIPANQGLDEERLANQRARVSKRRSVLDGRLAGAVDAPDVVAG